MDSSPPATLYLLLPSPPEHSFFLPSFNLFPNRNRNSHQELFHKKPFYQELFYPESLYHSFPSTNKISSIIIEEVLVTTAMDLKRLEKMRASCPSRKSMLDFLYNGNPPNDLEKPNTFEVGRVSSPPNDGIVAKEPFRDITNIQPSLNVGMQYEVVKRDRTTVGKKSTGSAIIGHALANSHDENYCVTKE